MKMEPVYSNIYDIVWTNQYTSNLGIGLYHSGVEIYGQEYGFCGHPFRFSGLIQKVPQETQELGEAFRYNQTILLGYTSLTEKEVENLLVVLAHEWHGNTYNMIQHNCNHFSDRFGRLLCGKGLPGWVNRAADLTKQIPFLNRICPVTWLRPFENNTISLSELVGEAVDSSRLWEITFCNRLPGFTM